MRIEKSRGARNRTCAVARVRGRGSGAGAGPCVELGDSSDPDRRFALKPLRFNPSRPFQWCSNAVYKFLGTQRGGHLSGGTILLGGFSVWRIRDGYGQFIHILNMFAQG